LYWQRYEYTLDKTWLRERAYPMLKGAAEFYRDFPNFQKGDDGKYHIHHVNNSESQWNSSDTAYELSAMHTVFPLVVRASEILNIDPNLRAAWQEIKDNLVPMPVRSRGSGGFGGFVYGGEGAITPQGTERELKSRFLNFTRLGRFIDTAGSGGAKIFRNRMRLREGPGAIDCEHIGALTGGVHSSLLQSSPQMEGGEPVIEVFSSWPREWDASFTLLASGAFMVSSSMEKGRIEFVEIQSPRVFLSEDRSGGGECRLRNPWPDTVLTLYRNGRKADDLSSDSSGLLMFPTARGETITIVPRGSTFSRKKVS
jgi:hypothetical protein